MARRRALDLPGHGEPGPGRPYRLVPCRAGALVVQVGRVLASLGRPYSDGDIVRLSPTEWDAARFTDITIFRRDAQGLLLERIDAPSASTSEDGLTLKNAVRREVADGTTTTVAEMRWRGVIDFTTIDLLSREPRDLRLHELARVIDNAGFGQRPTALYRTWFHVRLAAALQPLLMLLLSVSLIPAYSRTGSIGWLLFTGITIGFATFILAGVTTLTTKASPHAVIALSASMEACSSVTRRWPYEGGYLCVANIPARAALRRGCGPAGGNCTGSCRADGRWFSH